MSARVSTHVWLARSRYFQEIDLEINANLYALLASGFPSDRSLTAIETPDQVYSWNDVEEMSGRLASLLQALGLPAGARVAVQVEKSPRSEERRVGKECVSPCRSRWSPYNEKKKQKTL